MSDHLEGLGHAYRRDRERDDALVPDRKCSHGSRLRVCGHPDCLMARYRILKRATEKGDR